VAELRQEPKLELNLVNWAVLESLLIMRIQGMELHEALDQDRLTQVVHQTLELVLNRGAEAELDQKLIELLDADMIEMVITQEGKLAYRWKE